MGIGVAQKSIKEMEVGTVGSTNLYVSPSLAQQMEVPATLRLCWGHYFVYLFGIWKFGKNIL